MVPEGTWDLERKLTVSSFLVRGPSIVLCFLFSPGTPMHPIPVGGADGGPSHTVPARLAASVSCHFPRE